MLLISAVILHHGRWSLLVIIVFAWSIWFVFVFDIELSWVYCGSIDTCVVCEQLAES